MDIEGKIASFIAISEQMLELAKAGAWEEVTSLESDRRPKLEKFFNSLDQSERNKNSEQLRQAIERILSLDEEIIALGQECKTEAAKYFQQSQSARKATAAYQDNTPL